MPRQQKTPATSVSETNGLRFAPQANVSMPIAPRHGGQPQYAWQMTLEQFQRTYFPELFAKQDQARTAKDELRDAA